VIELDSGADDGEPDQNVLEQDSEGEDEEEGVTELYNL
jgi:hypothetical protein